MWLADTHLTLHEVVFSLLWRDPLFSVGLKDALLLCHRGGIATEGVNIDVSIVVPLVVGGEATVIRVDIGVTPRTIHMVVNSLTWTSLAATSRNMLHTTFILRWTDTAATHCSSRFL